MTKILLVEDDKSLREIYGVRLLAEGYDIVSAGDGEEALAMAIKERPQLIVSDVMMPKISGFDMLDILRSTTETKDIKVIMMTALSSEDQRQRGEQLGADRYLVKSQVGIEDVVRTVHDVLNDSPLAPNAFAPGAATPASPRPATSTVPPRQPESPAPSSTTQTPASQPSAPLQAPVPVSGPPPVATPPAPTSSPTPQTPASPQPQPPSTPPATPQTPPTTELPQPTAPFSTQRPAGLADRIIQPLERPAETGDPIGLRMDKELGTDTPPPAPNPGMPPVSSNPEPSGISFEETPRPNGQ
jgi:CheY-like chemotaxis protein